MKIEMLNKEFGAIKINDISFYDQPKEIIDVIDNLQQRNDKAIEYIENQKYEYDDGEYSGVDCCCDGFELLSILKGEDNE